MRGQDVVYANLAGAMAKQARVIVDAMQAAGLKRLIFISSMGIYGEVPGKTYRRVLDPYRDRHSLVRPAGSAPRGGPSRERGRGRRPTGLPARRTDTRGACRRG